MQFASHFFAGAFLCNFIPHLVAGVQGMRFPTPFSRLHGARLSSPLVNVLWGSFNLAAGVALLSTSPISIELSTPLFAFAFGFLGLGSFLAVHFAKVLEHNRG